MQSNSISTQYLSIALLLWQQQRMMPAEKFLCRCVAKVAICSSSMDKRPPIFLPNLILEEEILVKLSLEGLLQHDLGTGFPPWGMQNDISELVK